MNECLDPLCALIRRHHAWVKKQDDIDARLRDAAESLARIRATIPQP